MLRQAALTSAICVVMVWSATASAQGSLSTLPVTSTTPTPAPEPTYSEGFAAGVSAGQSEGFLSGYGAGVNEAVALCQSNPATCGIYLGSCLTAPQYGETEPNDNIVSADALVLDTKFWGQSYGLDDRDWYYITTSNPNQTLILNFSVPGGTLSGWEISIRDAAGNVFAQFDTGSVPAATSPGGDITYRATLGLVGTYYIALRPKTLNYEPYNIAAVLQDSPLDTQNFIVGFFDAEIEANNAPVQANTLASGVSMFGVINLSFAPGTEVPDVDGDGYEFSQGIDDDWYVYPTLGNEILTLSICDRAECEQGNWFFEVYDANGANQVAAGGYALPLLAINSDNGNPDEYVLGLRTPGFYYLRVSHKRLLTASCVGYAIDIDNNGREDSSTGSCGCESGYSCEVDIPNPGTPINVTVLEYPPCPGTGSETEICLVECACAGSGVPGAPAVGCLTTGLNPQPCSCPGGLASCELSITNPGNPTAVVTQQYPLCPDGSGGGDVTQCTAGCLCSAFGGVIEVPENALTSQYNFSVYGTFLPPNTAETDAYQDFQSRLNPYSP